jgi:predicted HicB family RNase H-like nuclease
MRYRPREETPKSKKIVVNVTPSDHQLLKILAVDNGITMSQFVIRALRHYLREVMKEDREIEKR